MRYSDAEINEFRRKAKAKARRKKTYTPKNTESCVIVSEMTDFSEELNEMQKLFPDVCKKFLKSVAKTSLKIVKDIAKREVKEKTKNYHKRFKVGKGYTYEGNHAIRVYNSARHAHLIEDGHVIFSHGKNVGFATGKKVFKQAEFEVSQILEFETGKLLSEYFTFG